MSAAGLTRPTSDFRSDTLTRPTAAMREAMLAAEVGDDVLDGDPTVGRLEACFAQWLGKQGALFVPSGTMANQVALGVWTRPGDEIVVQRWAHVTTFEAGAAGYLHGLQSITVGDLLGSMPADEVAAAIRPRYEHCPRTSLVCLEQTHNMAGGRVAPYAELEEVSAIARAAEAKVHLDGARLANAVVASGVEARRWAALADSVSVCLSKGLGAPVGSLVAGDAEFCAGARLVRKRLGGWMRQAGILAAAGLYAFEHHMQRLEQDHALARDLATRLAGIDGIGCDPGSVDTNIVMARIEGAGEGTTVAELSAALEARGVRALPMGAGLLRFTTHLDVGPADVERAEAELRALLER